MEAYSRMEVNRQGLWNELSFTLFNDVILFIKFYSNRYEKNYLLDVNKLLSI